jgi:hypothetical protein
MHQAMRIDFIDTETSEEGTEAILDPEQKPEVAAMYRQQEV